MNELNPNSLLAIVCAHHDEARSCIEAFRLKRINSIHQFPVFANESIILIESGQGAINAATAVGFIAGRLADTTLAWLNLGIAGHAQLELGSVVLAQRISDQNQPTALYPMSGRFKHIASVSLRSYTQLHRDYQGDEAYDMEGWSFFNAAQRFTPLEWIQCLKIISDNAAHPAPHQTNKTTRQQLAQLIQQQQTPINELIHALMQDVIRFRGWQQQPDNYQKLLDSFHFSASQQQQLQHLLRQWKLLSAPPFEDMLQQQQCRNSRQVIHCLQQALLQKQRDKYLGDES